MPRGWQAIRAALAMSAVLTAAAACSPATPTRPGDGATSSMPSGSGRTLVVALRVEPATLAFRPLREAGVTSYLTKRLFNAGMGLLDDRGAPHPYLVDALPQLNTSTWQVFPDGRMQTTYRLRRDAQWHDGTPLAAEDFVFAWLVYGSPELGLSRSTPMNAIKEVLAPDTHTLAIHWKQPYPDAAFLSAYQLELPALPRHLLQSSFQSDATEAFANHPYWAREYIGLGPYRLARWEPGAFIEGAAFEGHVLGRARISRMRFLFIGDGNTVLANVLAGEVHLTGDGSFRLEQVATLRREWAVRGPDDGGDIVLQPNQWRAVNFQLRPELATPRALLDPRVRRALSHATDKQGLNEALYGGAGIPADFVIPPLSDWGIAAEQVVTKYPYDLQRSEQLITEAGFARGADGSYTSRADGRFAPELKTNAAPDNEAELQVIASEWRKVGYAVQEAVLPVAQAQDAQVRATFSGMYTNSTPALENTLVSLNEANIPRPENRWRGNNRGGWSHPQFNRLVDSFTTTLDRNQRTQQVVEMARIFSEELPAVSLYFRSHPWAHIAALTGLRPLPPESNIGWNVHEWEFE